MQLTLIPEKSWWVWNDRKYVSQLTQVVMMANICLQTYLVSNLSALLTRADVGIYTMRCLVLLSTNEARSFKSHVSCHFGVNCGKCFGSFYCHQSSSHQWMESVSAMLTALQQFWLVRFFEPFCFHWKMQAKCSAWKFDDVAFDLI